MPDNVLIASDITVELGSAYVGSAYSPQASVTQTDTGWELTITYADPDTPGELATLTIPVDSAGFGEVTASVESGHGTPQVVVTESGPDTEKSFHFAFSGIGGFSPTITVTEIEGGHRVTVTDVDGTESFDVLDGDPSQAIEDAERAAALATAAAATADASAAAADTATAAAQSATTAAQTATSAAQTATSAANTATGRANTAAASATSAASEAQTATTAAQTATTAADTAADNAQDAADRANAAAAGITDAYSPMFTAGASEGVTGGGPSDTAAWVERTCPGTDGPAKVESIHGRTVVWNQLCDLAGVGQNKATVTRSGNVLTVAADGTAAYFGVRLTKSGEQFPANHKALLMASVVGSAGVTGFSDFRTNLTPATSGARTLTSDGTLLCICAPTSASAVYLNASLTGTSTSGQTFTVTNPMLLDLTQMFGSGNEPATVAEFEALFPDAYYPYDAGSLLSVQMEGIETVGFNLWDEEWENGYINDSTGQNVGSASQYVRSKNYIPVFSDTVYYFAAGPNHRTIAGKLYFYDADKSYISWTSVSFSGAVVTNSTKTTPSNARYMRFWCNYQNGYQNDLCINLSSSRNDEYEPYWQQTRPVPAATYFPDGMRSAGSVYDELTEGAAVTRVGSVDLGTLNWSANESAFYVSLSGKATGNFNLLCSQYPTATATTVANMGDKEIKGNAGNATIYVKDSSYSTAAAFKAAMQGVMLHYALATPTTQAIDPPLNLTYKAASGGTERITHTNLTAAPTLAVTYGSTPAGIVASALAAIADPDGPTATATHAVGTYLTMGGKLYRVTTAIAIGETITPGTNVTATTVMAEVLFLVQ